MELYVRMQKKLVKKREPKMHTVIESADSDPIGNMKFSKHVDRITFPENCQTLTLHLKKSAIEANIFEYFDKLPSFLALDDYTQDEDCKFYPDCHKDQLVIRFTGSMLDVVEFLHENEFISEKTCQAVKQKLNQPHYSLVTRLINSIYSSNESASYRKLSPTDEGFNSIKRKTGIS